MAANKFGPSWQEKFVVRTLSAAQRLNDAQLNPPPRKPAHWRAIRQSIVNMRDSISPESVSLPTFVFFSAERLFTLHLHSYSFTLAQTLRSG
jgi:hypothetical protein